MVVVVVVLCECCGGCGGCGGEVVVVLTVCMTQMSVHIRQFMHLIQVAEHLGVNSRRPRHLGLIVRMDGGRKMLHF